MKTKSTLEKAVKFVSNCKIIFSQRKNIFQKNFFTLLLCLITTVLFAQSGSCGSEITIDGSNEQKFTGAETSFVLQIKNTGNATDTYQLSADNFSDFNENPDGSSSKSNVLFTNRLENKTITLAPGESKEFYIKLNPRDLSQLDQWNGTKIIATSSTCPQSISQTIVYTYVPPKKTKGVGFNDFFLDFKKIAASKTLYALNYQM
ncbi:Fn3-like domain-containing protein [Flavobacterium sp. UBA4854]|uniref:COG1470 family protein n=1 Tax=Flavobacterium sp. UBA4854 TaxID=1946548 RepID=UPI00257AB8FD|nr:Fn3-like domain-containing protein [Flavobacterium sp. UBA4854]